MNHNLVLQEFLDVADKAKPFGFIDGDNATVRVWWPESPKVIRWGWVPVGWVRHRDKCLNWNWRK